MYKSGTRWCLWRWTDVVIAGVLYLRRLHLLQTPWFSVMLHWLTPDPQPDLHDHPVSFLSLLVRGWYDEIIPYTRTGYHCRHAQFRRRWFNFKRATDRHRIVATSSPCVTLVIAGPVVRSWGFWTSNGWVPWREYEHR
jgi:hypothetical protein